MNSRANIFEDMSEDTSIHVTVTRASKGGNNDTTMEGSDDVDDEDWNTEVNSSIEIRKASEDERRMAEQEKEKRKKEEESQKGTRIEMEQEDLDYWPDDWEDEDGWEE